MEELAPNRRFVRIVGRIKICRQKRYYWWFRNPKQPPGIVQNPENNGINYKPQLVSRISEPSTIWPTSLPPPDPLSSVVVDVRPSREHPWRPQGDMKHVGSHHLIYMENQLNLMNSHLSWDIEVKSMIHWLIDLMGLYSCLCCFCGTFFGQLLQSSDLFNITRFLVQPMGVFLKADQQGVTTVLGHSRKWSRGTLLIHFEPSSTCKITTLHPHLPMSQCHSEICCSNSWVHPLFFCLAAWLSTEKHSFHTASSLEVSWS